MPHNNCDFFPCSCFLCCCCNYSIMMIIVSSTLEIQTFLLVTNRRCVCRHFFFHFTLFICFAAAITNFIIRLPYINTGKDLATSRYGKIYTCMVKSPSSWEVIPVNFFLWKILESCRRPSVVLLWCMFKIMTVCPLLSAGYVKGSKFTQLFLLLPCVPCNLSKMILTTNRK